MSFGFCILPLLAARAQDVDVRGNLTMVDSTATEGNILKEGTLFIHNFGVDDTFIGANASNLTMGGRGNTATGSRQPTTPGKGALGIAGSNSSNNSRESVSAMLLTH